MADPLSVVASLAGLAGFAFQASKSLYQVIESFKSSKRAVRELREEIESLNGVLETLSQMADDYDAQLTSLKLPLLRCGKTCAEFENIISRCAGNSATERTSFRDWAKLQYRGGNIGDLKTTLAGYKSTISIAIGGATFRQAVVTANVLDDYKKMIEEATSDLQDHLQLIDERMQSLTRNSASLPTPSSSPEVEEIVEEKKSIGQCLAICTQVSHLIEAYQTRRVYYQTPSDSTSDKRSSFRAETATNELLMGFKTKLSTNAKDLQARLQELELRLGQFSKQSGDLHEQDTSLLQAMKEERDSITQCLEICADASDLTATVRTNIYEDVTSADNAHQLVVSTIGDLISAKHIITGSNSVQWLGQMSDETIQKLSNDNKRVLPENQASKLEGQKDVFHNLYGTGYQLKNEMKMTGGKTGK